MFSDVKIRPIQKDDIKAVSDIYNYYIQHTVATLDEDLLSEHQYSDKVAVVLSNNYPWYVLEKQNNIIGFAYANSWRNRSAFNLTCETTIYIKPENEGKGYGRYLYQHLLEQLRNQGFKVAVAAVTLPNVASERLHESLHMNKVAHFSSVGYKFEQWLDVGFYQINLN